jgi:hypothetical protein
MSEIIVRELKKSGKEKSEKIVYIIMKSSENLKKKK